MRLAILNGSIAVAKAIIEKSGTRKKTIDLLSTLEAFSIVVDGAFCISIQANPENMSCERHWQKIMLMQQKNIILKAISKSFVF
jgi:hypothetical protein